MTFEVRPLTLERFDDFADVINPNRRDTHCWCLSHRLSAPRMRELGETREDAMRALAAGPVAPGLVGYADDEPVAWPSRGRGRCSTASASRWSGRRRRPGPAAHGW